MRKATSMLLSLAGLVLLCLFGRGSAHATTLTVSKVCSDPTSTTCFTTITSAINAAAINQTNDNIIIEPGTYTESITLINGLPLSGVETSRTILRNPGTAPVITANQLSTVRISNLTIDSTSVGIQAVGSGVEISNMVFWGRSQGTAVLIQGNSTGKISNNTFFQNQTAISSQVNLTIENNIFSTNTTALTAVTPLSQYTMVTNNAFHNNSTIGPVLNYDPANTQETNIPNPAHPAPADPLFVKTSAAPPDMDLHVKEGSPCIGTGLSAADMGAFGGTGTDTIPFLVSGVTLTTSGPGDITVSWSPNTSYDVTNTDPAKQGGYNVHYRLNQSGPPYDAKTTVSSTFTSTVISGLTTTATPPAAPVLSLTGFANNTLLLTWSTVASATKYIVYYTDTDATVPTEQSVEVAAPVAFPYALTGLENLHHYTVEVAAVAQPTYSISVTAFDYTVKGTSGGDPGVAHESAYQSPDASIAIGAAALGARSNALPAADTYPEAIAPYPFIPNTGCFIATAAYGSYSSPQVQALRGFRDRYLLTNGLGRAVVRWYYTHGPKGARFLNDHPEWKPFVRLALLPAVGMAMFLTHSSALTKGLVVLMIGLSVFLLYGRKKMLSGGVR